MNEIKYQDGIWHTTEHFFEGRRIIIKSREHHGIKAHAFFPNSDKVDFTLRYNFINPDELLEKVKAKIIRITPKANS